MIEKQSDPNNEMKRVSSFHASAAQLDLSHDVITRSCEMLKILSKEHSTRGLVWQKSLGTPLHPLIITC